MMKENTSNDVVPKMPSISYSSARSANEKVYLTWNDLRFNTIVKDDEKSSFLRSQYKVKPILQGVSGRAMSGQLLAIMGPTGCGKTSLLNMLAARIPSGGNSLMSLSGTVRMNGRPRDEEHFRNISAYVMQDDNLYAYLTVFETLILAAHFFLPNSMSDADKTRVVESTISELGLVKVRDTIVGDENMRGVSGGERKRTSIATQLLSDPAVLFLDEPTSGLDAFQSQAVMESMKSLANSGRLVLSVIHQPRSSIYEMFDRLLLLSEGRTMYFGKACKAMQYFKALGHCCPEAYNPSDFFLDVLSPDNRDAISEQETRNRIQHLAEMWRRQAAEETSALHRRQQVMKQQSTGATETGTVVSRAIESTDASASAAAATVQLVADPAPRAAYPASTRGDDTDDEAKSNVENDVDESDFEDHITHPTAPAVPTGQPRRRRLPSNDSSAEGSEDEDFDDTNAEGFSSVRMIGDVGSLQKTWRNFLLLVWRSWTDQSRNRMALALRFGVTIFFGIMVGGVYFNIGDDQTSIQDRLGVLFFIIINQSFNSVNIVLNTFPREKLIVSRERSGRAYNTLSYFCAKAIVEAPLLILPAVIYCLICYPMIGLNPDRFWQFLLICIFFNTVSLMIGFFVSAICPTLEIANAIGTPVLICNVMFGGFYISVNSLPVVANLIPYLSYFRWSFQAVCINEFSGMRFSCDRPRDECTLRGEEVLEDIDFGGSSLRQALLWLGMVLLGITAVAFVALECARVTYLPLGHAGHRIAKLQASQHGAEVRDAAPIAAAASTRSSNRGDVASVRDVELVPVKQTASNKSSHDSRDRSEGSASHDGTNSYSAVPTIAP